MLVFIKKHKMLLNVLLFLIIALLTVYTIFVGNDITVIIDGLTQINIFYLFMCVVASLLFVLFEGIIFKILLQEDKKVPLLRCIKYTLIGYFYSGITPSASGGQPAQLLYMVKDKNNSGKSTVALLGMAFYYKLVMVAFGLIIFVLFADRLSEFFGIYSWLYYIGVGLNIIVLGVIMSFMMLPNQARFLMIKFVKILIKIKIFTEDESRYRKIDEFIEQYKMSVKFIFAKKLQIVCLTLLTFLQRSIPSLIPVFLYLGLPLEGGDLFTIFLIQLSIYVAVDMLPIPGAQGITELIFVQALGLIFTSQYIATAVLLTRSISFYIILLIGLAVVIWSTVRGLNK